MQAPRIRLCVLSWTRRVALAAAVVSGPALFASLPITVAEPAQGAVLRGGELATIRWTATAALPAGVDEWEAFLSVDGGRYYATRITPHLDIDLRSFEWRVPNVSSSSVRLLLRVGDEREERSVELPLRLSIVASPDMRPSDVPVAAEEDGEAARPGDPAVAEWVTGDRHGHTLTHVRAPQGQHLGQIRQHPPTSRHACVRSIASARRLAFTSASAPFPSRFFHASRARLTRDILLLVRRRNI